jgi:hypothetical protein
MKQLNKSKAQSNKKETTNERNSCVVRLVQDKVIKMHERKTPNHRETLDL